MIVKADCESDGSFYLTITDLGADLVLGGPSVPHTVPATGQRHRGLKEHPTSCSNFVNFEEPGSINGAMMRFTAKHPILDVIGQRLCKK